jgi:DNA polymerase-3 subunit gamma/tau
MDEIADQSVLKDLSDFQRYVSILLKAESEMGHTGFPRLLLEMTLLRMTTLAPAIPVEELLSRLDSIRGAVSSGTVASPLPQWGRQLSGSPAPLKSPSDAIQKQSSSEIPKKANADTKAADSMYVSSGNKDWQGFVEMLRKEKPMLGTMLEHAYPVVVTSELLEIGFLPGSFEYTTLNSPATLAEITQFAGKFFKADTVVRLKVLHAKDTATNSIADTKIQEAATRDNELSNIARSNPSVQAALEVFGGELLKVEPVN